jgi:transposase
MTSKRHSTEVKVKAVLELLKERKTSSEIAGEMGVHPMQLSVWKKQAISGLPRLFDGSARDQGQKDQELKDKLYQQIGQLQMELEWLKKIKKLRLKFDGRWWTPCMNSCPLCDNVNFLKSADLVITINRNLFPRKTWFYSGYLMSSTQKLHFTEVVGWWHG